jgi:hypothetical protein
MLLSIALLGMYLLSLGLASAKFADGSRGLILTSMVALHQYYFGLYKGLMNALTFMNGELDTFTSNFAVQVDQLKTNKIMLDVSMMLFGM